MFYTRSNGVRVPVTVVGFAPDGLVDLETLKGGLSSEEWKEVIEWLLKRKEDTGKMKWDDAAWHCLRRWGCFMAFEVCVHDGAYKGRLHSHVFFIGRKTLTMRQKTYNDVHGYYRARPEDLFAHLWCWRVVCDIWLGSHQDLHANTRILLHVSKFMLRRQKRYQPYGSWEHIPSSIWTEEEAPNVDEEEEDTFLCQVCGTRDTLECSTCDLYLCRGCMDEHTCDIDVCE